MFLHWSDRQCAFGGFGVPGSEATRQPLCLVDGKVKLFLSYFQRICPFCQGTPVARAPADGSPRWRKRQAELARRRAPTTPQPIFSSAKGTRTSVETQRSKSSFCVFHIRPMPEEALLKAPRIAYFPTHTQPLAVCLPPRRQRCIYMNGQKRKTKIIYLCI